MIGGRQRRQDRMFYEFCLDDVVHSDHLLRSVDAALDLSWLRADLWPYYNRTGCPSIHPKLMMRMLLVGYCYSIRSERQLCQQVELNLAYRWFCQLRLEDKVLEDSTFWVNRHGRFRDSDILCRVFGNVVRRCIEAGLVKGESFAVDASVIEADANRFKRVEGVEINWTDEERGRRPVRKYLAAFEGENAPTNPDRAPWALSPTDTSEAWTTRGRDKVMFGYSLNYLIDDGHAIMVDVEATPTRISKKIDATKIMVARTEDRFALKPKRMAADLATDVTPRKIDFRFARDNKHLVGPKRPGNGFFYPVIEPRRRRSTESPMSPSPPPGSLCVVGFGG